MINLLLIIPLLISYRNCQVLKMLITMGRLQIASLLQSKPQNSSFTLRNEERKREVQQIPTLKKQEIFKVLLETGLKQLFNDQYSCQFFFQSINRCNSNFTNSGHLGIIFIFSYCHSFVFIVAPPFLSSKSSSFLRTSYFLCQVFEIHSCCPRRIKQGSDYLAIRRGSEALCDICMRGGSHFRAN